MSLEDPDASSTTTQDMPKKLEHLNPRDVQSRSERRGYDGDDLRQGDGVQYSKSIESDSILDLFQSHLTPWRAAGAQRFEDKELEMMYGQFFVNALFHSWIPFIRFLLVVRSSYYVGYFWMKAVKQQAAHIEDFFMLIGLAMILFAWASTLKWSCWTGRAKRSACFVMIWIVRLRVAAFLVEHLIRDVPLQKSFLVMSVLSSSSTVLTWNWNYHVLNILVLTLARPVSTFVQPGLLETRGYEPLYMLATLGFCQVTSLLSLSLHERYRASFLKIWDPSKRQAALE